MTHDYIEFIRELPKSFPQIGSMLPSSAFLGRKMVGAIREASRPLNILEVGPGTGPFTRQILKLMKPTDRFVICEINTRFMSLLKAKLLGKEYFKRVQKNVEFFEGAIQKYAEDNSGRKFDAIVCSLPFSNFSPETVDEIFSCLLQLLATNGSLTFCEYAGVRKFGFLFGGQQYRQRISAVNNVIKKWENFVAERGEIKSDLVLLNVPPAYSIRLEVVH